MVVIRVEIPLLWVEYDENDEPLVEGDIFVVRGTEAMFQVETIIHLLSDGVILSLTGAETNRRWPKEGERVVFVKILRG